ncbi:hypothetical protein HZB60_09765 [candidate division KSB1 bacterium]|nr:hypothetical protein [candidate division KSB1 bacterium]
MKKNVVFWTLLALAIAAIASVPFVQQATLAPAAVNKTAQLDQSVLPDEIVIPVEFMNSELAPVTRNGRNPFDVTDSMLFIDSMEGTYAAWTSQDLAAGTFWHIDSVETGFAGQPGLPHWWCGSRAFPPTGDRGGYNNHWLQYLILDTLDFSAVATPQLAFKAAWAVETPGGEPAGYNMWDGWNVWGSSDNGATWSVLEPSAPDASPAIPATNYTNTSSFAFGDEWGMGVGIPAYGGYHNTWDVVTVPLAAYVGQSSVLLRIAFCSDPGFCTLDADSLFGLLVDSVRVTDGATTLLSNDGIVDDFAIAVGAQSADTWEYSAADASSPTHSYHAAEDTMLQRGLYSYPITKPAGYQRLKLTYWVHCDLPDQDGDGQNTLEDYYAIYSSTDDGATWTQVSYDYGYANGEAAPGGNSLTGWVKRTRGLASGGVQQTEISLVSDSGTTATTIRIAFEIKTDNNQDGGTGTGLWIDDVEIIAQRASTVDLATQNIVVPYPITVGLARAWTFDFKNEGLNSLSPVRGKLQYTAPDGTTRPAAGDSTVVSSGALNYGETRTVPRIWANPDAAGAWRIRTIANATGELDRSNDTTYTPINQTQNDDSTLAVYVRPTGTYELGYGRRAVGNAYLNPRYIHFQPVGDGVPAADADTMDIYQLRVMWRYDAELADSGGRVRIDFYSEGVDSFHTGPVINSIITRVDTLETIGLGGFIKWWEFDLSVIPGFSTYVGPGGNFWLSITQLDSFIIDGELTPAPLPLGISPSTATPDARTYFLNTTTGVLTQSGGRLLLNVLTRPAIAGVASPVVSLTARRESGPGGGLVLNWLAPANAHGYKVYRMLLPTDNYLSGTLLTPLPITGTTYTDAGAIGASTKYFYQVVSVN